MCDLCDRPDLEPDAVLARIRRKVEERRFALVHVAGSAKKAEVAYTAGLTEHGVPELVLTAVRARDAERLLGLWGDYLLDRSAVLPGETLESGPWLLQAVAVDRPEEHLLLAHDLYGERLRALQLVWADAAGRWPWDPRHRGRPSGQPVLGPRAPAYCAEHAPSRLGVPPHL